MNRRVLTKDVEVNGKKYRLTKCDARTGCWLFSFLGAKIEKVGGSIFSAIGKCTRAEFDEIQGIALTHVAYLDTKEGNTFPTAIVSGNGVWVDKELGADVKAVMDITSEYLGFVIEPFLAESGSNSQTEIS